MLNHWAWALCSVGLLLFTAAFPRLLHRLWTSIEDTIKTCISTAFDCLLTRRKRIVHRQTGQSIPSCPWKWPNGQGDVAKFLQGAENSEQWGRAYGECYRIWSGTTPEVVVSKPQHIKTAFQDSDKHFKADNNDSGYLMSQVLGKCLGLISGKDYHTLRDILEPHFTYSQSNLYLERIEQRTKQYLKSKHIVNNGRKDRLQLDPVNDFKFLPFLIVADILYGPVTPDMETQLLSMAPVREKLFQHVIRGGWSRFKVSKYLPVESNRVLRDFQQQWVTFNTYAYERAVKECFSETVVVQLFQSAQKGSISWDHCHQTLDEMLFANLDVTMGSLSWNFVHLADSPSVQSQLRSEIFARMSLCPDKTEASELSAKMKEYLQSSTTLLAACILESSRLRPLAAFTVPQSAPTDRVIDDYVVPARTSLVVDTYALNIKNEFWGEDRHAYRPQRFLGSSRSDMRYRYWRFGFGPRQCLGKYVAELILRTVLATVVRNFALYLPITETGSWKRHRETWISQPKIKLELECL